MTQTHCYWCHSFCDVCTIIPSFNAICMRLIHIVRRRIGPLYPPIQFISIQASLAIVVMCFQSDTVLILSAPQFSHAKYPSAHSIQLVRAEFGLMNVGFRLFYHAIVTNELSSENVCGLWIDVEMDSKIRVACCRSKFSNNFRRLLW